MPDVLVPPPDGVMRRAWAQPVAIPDDLATVPEEGQATGVVRLPHHVQWSGPKWEWDLDDVRDRRAVYELVLSEGTQDDVRRFVRLPELLALWEVLVLPARVRMAWVPGLREHGLLAA
jgi:hypothetical protein